MGRQEGGVRVLPVVIVDRVQHLDGQFQILLEQIGFYFALVQ